MIVIFEIPIMFFIFIILGILGQDVGDTLFWCFMTMGFMSIIMTIASIYLVFRKGNDKTDTIVAIISTIISFVFVILNFYWMSKFQGVSVTVFEALDLLFLNSYNN